MDYDQPIVSKQFKVIILGDGAVGKSSIAARFANDQFSQTYKQTIGVDFSIKKLQLPRKSFSASLNDYTGHLLSMSTNFFQLSNFPLI